MDAPVPSNATLKKYGLSPDEWTAMFVAQGGVCYICRKLPTTGRLCTDHEHVKGWKQMAPEQRKLYVRALLCWTCNHFFMGRGINLAKARNVVQLLIEYTARRPLLP